MIELFSLGFILVFTLFLIVLVCLNINVMLNKGKEYSIDDCNNKITTILKYLDNSSNKELVTLCSPEYYTLANNELNAKYVQNSVQENWKESVPDHKTRVSLRKKRKKKDK